MTVCKLVTVWPPAVYFVSNVNVRLKEHYNYGSPPLSQATHRHINKHWLSSRVN
jgi:hypothetical protein